MSNSGSPGCSHTSSSSLQDSDMPAAPPGTGSSTNSPMSYNSPQPDSKCSTPDLIGPKIQISTKGVENAKKRLRAFSIQKKAPLVQSVLPKLSMGTGNTVLIGKLCSAKVSVKPPQDQDEKKPPRPPKPGSSNKRMESYMEVKKKTLAEIEDMKRKMELVELGIPLGLICPPTQNSDSVLPTKAMPTKAMPPIKSFLGPDQLDKIIREAKQAKAEGKEFKFDYQKLLPGYDNPFQRKKEDSEAEKIEKFDRFRSYASKSDIDDKKYREKELKKDSKRDFRRHSEYRNKTESHVGYNKDERHSDRSKDRTRGREEKKVKANDEVEKDQDKYGKITSVDLKGFVVCDSWSPSDKTCSPTVGEDNTANIQESLQQVDANKETVFKNSREVAKEKVVLYNEKTKTKQQAQTPIPDLAKVKTEPKKIEKLQSYMDAFSYEIDVDDDAELDMFDEASDIQKFAKAKQDKKTPKNADEILSSKDTSVDVTAEDFLESVLNELKHEVVPEDLDKGLVEYELSPEKNEETPNSGTPERSRSGTVTPEIKEFSSQRSNYSETSYRSDGGYKSTESGYKSTESGYKSTVRDSFRLVDAEESLVEKMSKSTIDSLETWSFVLKICQPLLFRHDRNKCYKETQADPKIWYAANPKLCNCVRDRSVVYEELETCKMGLVDRVYGCDQLSDSASASKRDWYKPLSQCFQETKTIQLSSEWETEDSQLEEPATPTHVLHVNEKRGDVSLDQEYQRFMDAVWPEISEGKSSRSTTPTKDGGDGRNKKKTERDDKRKKKVKLNSESWSMESEIDEEDKSSKKSKLKERGKKRKRTSTSSNLSETSNADDGDKKNKKKLSKKKANKKNKAKLAKRRKLEKKYLKKLKEKQKKKSKKLKDKTGKIEIDSDEGDETEKSKKSKKKKQQKLKKKDLKRKKVSSSSESSSSSDSETESEKENKRKKGTKKKTEEDRSSKKKRRKEKKKKRQQSSSESTQEDSAFDVNILNNIKTEKLTDDEKAHKKLADIHDFSPRRQQDKPRQEIINMKELQNDLEFSNMHIKLEKVDSIKESEVTEEFNEPVREEESEPVKEEESIDYHMDKDSPAIEPVSFEQIEVELPKESPIVKSDEASQASSQESAISAKEQNYEKDESHLRPSSQNSNYSFNDVISASHTGYYQKTDDEANEYQSYEMYEQMAMEYQSGVASQSCEPSQEISSEACRIETVVSGAGSGGRGEIKCDWRAGDEVRAVTRPSRWGLKPGEANIVLTGAKSSEESPVYKIRSVLEQDNTYQIESITGHSNDSATGYDEAYVVMYGASDRLQYGDCFMEAHPASCHPPAPPTGPPRRAAPPLPPSTEDPQAAYKRSSLDDRIDRVLTNAPVAGNSNADNRVREKQDEKGILTKTIKEDQSVARILKRVSFADGYKPGQDSDTEEPPVKRRKRGRRLGCAWPCPASHIDHVPLWDALPPPPPPPGSPPPPAAPPPLLLLPPDVRNLRNRDALPPPPPHHHYKFDPTTMPMAHMMPPEPPPGILNLSHIQM